MTCLKSRRALTGLIPVCKWQMQRIHWIKKVLFIEFFSKLINLKVILKKKVYVQIIDIVRANIKCACEKKTRFSKHKRTSSTILIVNEKSWNLDAPIFLLGEYLFAFIMTLK